MKKPALIGAVFLGAVGVLVWQAFGSMIPVKGLHEIVAEGYKGGRVQVDQGEVASIDSLAPMRFTVTMKNNPSLRLAVESTAIVPENFKVGVPVSLQGELDRERGVFQAYRVSTQCPSRYEASQEAYRDGENAGPGLQPDATPAP